MRSINAFLRIALTVAIINAAARVGFAYWAFFQFKDNAQQAALFGGMTPTDVLQHGVFEKANELMLPVTTDQVVVTRSGPRTLIEANYVQPIEYFPNQKYPMKFSFQVEGFTLGGIK
jgi:hypothetical protein